MKYFILFLPLFLFSDEYFAKIEPFEKYIFASKISGLVVFTNEKIISNIAKDETIVKLDDKIAKINYEVASSVYDIKKSYYEKIKTLKTKSKNEKDNEKILYLNAKQTYINAKDILKNTDIKAKNLYINNIMVKEGSYVNPGTLLFEAYDISKAKLTIFVTKEDIKNIQNKEILVNDKKDFKLYKYHKIADSVHISSYKVQLIGPPPKEFSHIAKVLIK